MKQVASLQAKQQLSPASTAGSATSIKAAKEPAKLPPKHGLHWSNEDRAHLIESIRLGKLKPEIAEALGRTERAVELQWEKEQSSFGARHHDFQSWCVQSATRF